MDKISTSSKASVFSITLNTTTYTVAMAATGTTQIVTALHSMDSTSIAVATTAIAVSSTPSVEAASPRIETTLAAIAIHRFHETPPQHNRRTSLKLLPG
jgi:hypothetical protein